MILGILMDYISMKKKLNRLTKANIDNIKRQEMDLGVMLKAERCAEFLARMISMIWQM